VIPRASIAVVLALVCVLAAGCGVRSNKPFTATGSAACFTKKGFAKVTTNPDQVGFIAAFADNGGLRAATSDGNLLTVAFTLDDNAVPSTKAAFKAHAPARLRPRMNDIMESERNAVLVWTTSPSPQQLTDAISCLHP
jgi:hypothetical protein